MDINRLGMSQQVFNPHATTPGGQSKITQGPCGKQIPPHLINFSFIRRLDESCPSLAGRVTQ